MSCTTINPAFPPIADQRLTDLISYSEYLYKTLQNLADALLIAKDILLKDDKGETVCRISGMLDFCIGAYLDELEDFDSAVRKAKGNAP